MSDWKIITGDMSLENNSTMARLYAEAMTVAPQEYITSKGKMLPRKPVAGRCAICGKTEQLTKEHIPPKATGNKERSAKHTLQDWLNSTSVTDIAEGKVNQGGIFGYTICGACNSYTGKHYGNEYKKWTIQGSQILSVINPAELDAQTQLLAMPVKFGDDANDAIQPGALVRQVLSMFCSLGAAWDLAERYPDIRDIVLNQKTIGLPKNFGLGLSLYVGPRVRIIGPQLIVEQKSESWSWVMEIAYPPFAFLLVIASNTEEPGKGLMMNDWTLIPVKEKKSFEGIAQIGFGWSPYPGEYRTSAAIEQGICWN